MSDPFENNAIDGELGYLLLMANKNLSVISELSLDISQHDLYRKNEYINQFTWEPV